jgi:hypothetical protein
MAGDDEDMLLEIDRILAGEDGEPEATVGPGRCRRTPT